MFITKIKLDQIYLDEGPFEKLDEKELEMLVESIQDFGLIYPLVVQEKEGQFVIVDGRNRIRALKRLGITEAPAIVIQDEDL
ncbi:MAG: ParB N-terminal domain-containing protein, partial [Nanopusillaceae archaeon]